jgi:hypothetical protein
MIIENHGGMISMKELLIRPPALSGISNAQSNLVAKQEEVGEGNEFGPTNYLCSHFEGILNIPLNLMAWCRRLYFPSKRRCAMDFYRLRPDLNPRTFGPMASTVIITPPRTT